MAITRCLSCAGSGQILGGGMIRRDCFDCNGSGKPEKITIDYTKAKNTKAYKNAKKRLRKSNQNLSEEDAENLLDQELNKEIGD